MNLSDAYFLPYSVHPGTTAMTFVDGENLAIQFEKVLGSGSVPDHVRFVPNVYVWSKYANAASHQAYEVVRRYYYTSIPGQQMDIHTAEERLKELGIQAPRLFHKPKEACEASGHPARD